MADKTIIDVQELLVRNNIARGEYRVLGEEGKLLSIRPALLAAGFVNDVDLSGQYSNIDIRYSSHWLIYRNGTVTLMLSREQGWGDAVEHLQIFAETKSAIRSTVKMIRAIKVIDSPSINLRSIAVN